MIHFGLIFRHRDRPSRRSWGDTTAGDISEEGSAAGDGQGGSGGSGNVVEGDSAVRSCEAADGGGFVEESMV